ncbi:MAG: pyridine nucleotide-disulfide oxidoreductase [Candidatus Omnitrophica bacterium]|nr:pyridine nucleotide-disulfide oxidoreductase [Candidatus Omnitrophota bacterium]
MKCSEYDLAVIGGGAAGLFAVNVANRLGAKTCLIEKKKLGGDCTWYGCIPSKALLKAGHAAHAIRTAERFGVRAESCRVDCKKVMEHVRRVREEVYAEEIPEVFEDRGIRVLIGNPQFENGHTLTVHGQRVSAKKIILCTGSHAAVPPVEGLQEAGYLTNEQVFELDQVPESLIVLGGGPVGVEMAQAFTRLGAQVTLVEMAPRILGHEEEDLSEFIRRKLEEDGIRILTATKAVRAVRRKEQAVVTIERGEGQREEIEAEHILAATGRVPNLEGLRLEKIGVKTSKKGVEVNDFLQTSQEDIFAAGDVVGPYLFTHVAAYQAAVCVRNALLKRVAWQKADYGSVGWATFIEPEIAHIGLTETQARREYGEVKVYGEQYRSSDRAKTDMEQEGMLKVITDQKGNLLGAHMAGADAGEVVQGLLLAKTLRIPFPKLAEVLFVYPTLSQLIQKTAAQSLSEKMENPLVKTLLGFLRQK